MSRVLAPTARRRPISRVRSVTETSMMFMIPMPPTISDTDAMAPSRIDITCAELSCAANTSDRLRIVKSSSWPGRMRWRCRSSASISCCAWSMACGPMACTMSAPTALALAWFAAEHLLLGRRDRDQDDVVLVLPGRRLALRRQHADHGERHVLDAIIWPIGSASPNRFSATVSPSSADLGGGVDVLAGEGPAGQPCVQSRIVR